MSAYDPNGDMSAALQRCASLTGKERGRDIPLADEHYRLVMRTAMAI